MVARPICRIALSPAALTIAIGVWATSAIVGSWTLWNHASQPGIAAAPPGRWPTGSRLSRRPGRPMLVMFAHPKCPCTRASIRELERLLAQMGPQCDTAVVFVQPPGTGDQWPLTDTWRAAAAIPGVQVALDRGGAEAGQFGARTSGQVLLYDAGGTLEFQGGITAARGHEGENTGSAAIVAFLNGRPAPSCQPTFGCALGVAPATSPFPR